MSVYAGHVGLAVLGARTGLAGEDDVDAQRQPALEGRATRQCALSARQGPSLDTDVPAAAATHALL
jgi:hypothetical protein